MRPIQRVVSAPNLITAPHRFSGSLVSWRNPSRSGTLGHYVTPDAPAGVSEGLAVASPRSELPAPAQPWWWPRPPAAQRHVTTSTPTPEPEPGSVEERAPALPPAVPVYPLTEQALVSAAGAEVSSPTLTLPAVQRRAAEPEASQELAADPDLSTGESPPEAQLPSVVATRPQPLPEAPAISWPGRRSELPTTRRLGLGAPLQRIPDVAGGPSADATTMQRRVDIEVGAGPMGVAQLVPESPPMVSMPASPLPSGTIGAADAFPEPASDLARPPSAEPGAAAVVDRADGGPPLVQRRVEASVELVEPTQVAPLVSDATPMTSVAAPPAEAPPTESVVTVPSAVLGPSPGFTQRAVDIPMPPKSHPAESPSVEATTATPVAGAADAAGGAPSMVQRRVEAEAETIEVVPMVSGSMPMALVAIPSPLTLSADPAARSGFAGSRPSPESIRRKPDTPRVSGRGPVGLSSIEPAGPAAADPAEAGLSPVQRRVEASVEPAEPTQVAPLVSEAPLVTSAAVPPTETPSSEAGPGSASAPGPPREFVQRAADTSLLPGPDSVDSTSGEPTAPDPAVAGPSPVQRRAETGVEPVKPAELAPLVSDASPLTSVALPPVGAPSLERGAESSSADRALSPGFAQRAIDTAQRSGPGLVWPPTAEEETTATPVPAVAYLAGPSIAQRVEAATELRESSSVAPLVTDSAPTASVIPPAAMPPAPMPSAEPMTRSASAGPSRLPRFAQRAIDATLQRGPRPMRSPLAEPAVAMPPPAAAAPAGAAPSAVPEVTAREIAPLVSDSEPMASVVMRSPASPAPASPTRSTDEGLALQRFADTASPTAELPLTHVDHPVVGLVGDRPV
jgi:hypothetical protein